MRRDPARQQLATRLLSAGVLAIPFALYLADPTPRYFLGDSTTYLQTAISGTIPNQRSFVYGFLIRALARPFGAVDALIVAQIVAATATLGIVWRRLRGQLATPFALALTAALACEPVRLLQQRYVMTESFGSLLFVGSVAAWLAYLDRPRMRWLAAAQLAGLLAVSLRFAFFPVYVGLTFLAPMLAHVGASSDDDAGGTPETNGSGSPRAGTAALRLRVRAGIALLASLGFAVGGLAVYQQVHTRLAGRSSPLFGYDGFFLLGVASPLVTPDLTDDPRLRAVLAEPHRHTANDPIFGRAWEIFGEGGLIPRVAALAPGLEDPNRAAGQLARAAIAREPLAFLQLGLANVTACLDSATAQRALRIERGTDHPLNDKSAAVVLKKFPRSSIPTADDTSLTQRWHAASGRWPALLAGTPLLFAIAFAARPRRVTRRVVLLFLCLAAVVGTAVFLAAMPVPRYLHEVPVLAALLVGEWLGRNSGLQAARPRVLSAA